MEIKEIQKKEKASGGWLHPTTKVLLSTKAGQSFLTRNAAAEQRDTITCGRNVMKYTRCTNTIIQ